MDVIGEGIRYGEASSRGGGGPLGLASAALGPRLRGHFT